jgi:hypothetical protein
MGLIMNVGDFPVPRGRRRARIGRRNQSFQELKSHEHGFYSWDRLGKACAFSACTGTCSHRSISYAVALEKSRRAVARAASAPTNSARIKLGASMGRMPEKEFVNDRAIVIAGLANEVDAVNQ